MLMAEETISVAVVEAVEGVVGVEVEDVVHMMLDMRVIVKVKEKIHDLVATMHGRDTIRSSRPDGFDTVIHSEWESHTVHRGAMERHRRDDVLERRPEHACVYLARHVW